LLPAPEGTAMIQSASSMHSMPVYDVPLPPLFQAVDWTTCPLLPAV
jgi:hypothetical protein